MVIELFVKLVKAVSRDNVVAIERQMRLAIADNKSSSTHFVEWTKIPKIQNQRECHGQEVRQKGGWVSNAIEFLPESGISGKAGDMRFDGKVWDCKYIPLANINTIRTCIKDARKADNVIFCWDDKSRIEDLRQAITSEVGNFKKQNRINKLPDIYWANKNGKLHLMWKK